MPACYGPGPDLNLIPTRSIEVYRDGTLVKNETFPSDRDHQTYELTLPAGRYSLKVSGIAPIEVRVSPHQHAVLDLPLPACL